MSNKIRELSTEELTFVVGGSGPFPTTLPRPTCTCDDVESIADDGWWTVNATDDGV